MKRRRVLVILAVAFVAAVVAIVFWSGEREPEYQGKKLSEWLEIYRDGYSLLQVGYGRSEDSARAAKQVEEARSAVRHMGTNCIPVFLRWLDASPPPEWQTKFRNAAFIPKHFRDARRQSQLLNGMARLGLTMLGDEAMPAIPALARVMNEGHRGVGCMYALEELGTLGPRGLEQLVMTLSNQMVRPVVRMRVAEQIGSMGTNGIAGIPALIKALGDPNALVRASAASSLGEFGVNAQEAVPALIKATADVQNFVRADAKNALLQIAPEALTNEVTGSGVDGGNGK